MPLFTLPQTLQLVARLYQERFPEAAAVFLAGSIVRGQATISSDVDVVVVYEQLAHAYRDTFYFEGHLIEVFVHDPATLRYFIAEDAKRGVPSMATMLSEGIAVPEPSTFATAIKVYAQAQLAQGRPPLSQAELDGQRYALTSALDDLRSPRTRQEALAMGAALYEALANFYLRTEGQWDARGKSIPRKLYEYDASFAELYQWHFQQFFEQGDVEGVLALVKKVLEPYGGLLSAGYRVHAPAAWRLEDV